nr:MAG TPA: hypothetical protein [Caudoviricetes sp.]
MDELKTYRSRYIHRRRVIVSLLTIFGVVGFLPYYSFFLIFFILFTFL